MRSYRGKFSGDAANTRGGGTWWGKQLRRGEGGAIRPCIELGESKDFGGKKMRGQTKKKKNGKRSCA